MHPLLFCPLASGSKGNLSLLRAGGKTLLIDAGLSGRQTALRLSCLGISLEEIDAILITHEHADHIAGLKILSLRKKIPIIANRETALGICAALQETPPLTLFRTGESFLVGAITITPFSIPHDTLDPVGFLFEVEGTRLAVCTDLGIVTSEVRTRLAGCHCILLEANHDVEMVWGSARPRRYKERVLGRTGHLSNEDAATLLTEIAHPELQKVYLGHLSEECNAPAKALQVVEEKMGAKAEHLSLQVAHQHTASEPWQLHQPTRACQY